MASGSEILYVDGAVRTIEPVKPVRQLENDEWKGIPTIGLVQSDVCLFEIPPAHLAKLP
jgi:hypothetical protein